MYFYSIYCSLLILKFWCLHWSQSGNNFQIQTKIYFHCWNASRLFHRYVLFVKAFYTILKGLYELHTACPRQIFNSTSDWADGLLYFFSLSRWPVSPLTKPNRRAHHRTIARISISFSVAQETISISIRPFQTWETWKEMVPLSLSQHNLWPPESVSTVFRGYTTATSIHACDHLCRHLRLGWRPSRNSDFSGLRSCLTVFSNCFRQEEEEGFPFITEWKRTQIRDTEATEIIGYDWKLLIL